ncbi:thioredoxin domain-containing protein [Paenibacillus sp. 19GGS1-52]|uniref:thioredoxin domain-containing protein n=1 Tax=Paenibacillus sp. 19GGS1-52 TaxID=2758563 RepID=UPI001EFB0467|nr:thioredoxin domain-containing protein [Paenibacillus sp. 19GGS1-52]ULO09610.1 thioredoxin domain-containing protein [Paenibacillus sp. 19GGS1-52]
MELKEGQQPNRLINEKSPYLLQHALNPVDWYSWGEEAFAKAQAENKPIFLSVGYSTCHWCHVMERESFEDEEVANLLNENYISIKVDREERPDIDALYMSVCQALTGSGGWPLTVLLTPEKKPFYAGTYFPKRRMFGRLGIMDVLEQIRDKWAQDGASFTRLGDDLLAELQSSEQKDRQSGGAEVGEELLHEAFQLYERQFDEQYGGFGNAPKFPSAHNLSFLLAYSQAYDKPEALQMVETTLESMFRGGLYDHVGFGFSRYSTDREWLVPHFEKMLFDNALLAFVYLEAFQITRKPLYAEIAESVFTYVLRDMTSPEGAFYCAEDADSEGEEGKFYVFSRDEIEEALGLEDMHSYCHVYGITPEGNFEGFNIPNLLQDMPDEMAEKLGMNPLGLRTRMEEWREKLFAYREQRIHPSKDDKVLTAWNGLMIAALAKGAKALQKPEYAKAAAAAADFIWEKMRREDGRLLARYRDGDAAIMGYVDDYAFMLWGLTELYEATGKAVYLERALILKDGLLELFRDEEHGGFFFCGRDGEQLPIRSKELYDGAMPSGNSVAAKVLWKLAAVTQDVELKGIAERTAGVLGAAASAYPTGYAIYLQALLAMVGGGKEWVLSGKHDDPALHGMLAQFQQAYMPDAALLVKWEGTGAEDIVKLLPHLADKPSIHGAATAYVCRDFACREPITNVEAVRELLAAKGKA